MVNQFHVASIPIYTEGGKCRIIVFIESCVFYFQDERYHAGWNTSVIIEDGPYQESLKSVNYLRWHSIIMRWNFFLNCIVVSRKERFERIFSICSKQLRNSTAEFICIQLVKNCEYANMLKVSSVQKLKHIFHPFYKIQVFFNILWNNGPHTYIKM